MDVLISQINYILLIYVRNPIINRSSPPIAVEMISKNIKGNVYILHFSRCFGHSLRVIHELIWVIIPNRLISYTANIIPSCIGS